MINFSIDPKRFANAWFFLIQGLLPVTHARDETSRGLTIATSFRPADCCRFYTLAIETACLRVLEFTGFLGTHARRVLWILSHIPFFAPRPEIVVYGFIMREVRRKSSPLTACFEHIKNAIHDPAQTDFTGTASLVLLR